MILKHFLRPLLFFTSLIIAIPVYAQTSWDSAVRLCRDSTGQAALDRCNNALRQIPPDMPASLFSEIHRYKGVALGEMGRTDESLYELRQAVKLDPQDSKSQYNMGVALEEKGHDWMALLAYRKATKLDPNMLDAWVNVGMAAYKTGRYKESTAAFEKVLQIDPSYFDKNPDQREAWKLAIDTQPYSVASRREVSVRFTPSLGYLFKFADEVKPYMSPLFYILPDVEVDVQIYRRLFGTASFMYARTSNGGTVGGFSANGSANIYGISFGVKYVSNDEIKALDGTSFLDRSRFWIAGAVGPYITNLDASSDFANISTPTSTNFGMNFGTGFDYYLYPNLGFGLQLKLHYIRFNISDIKINGVSCPVNYGGDYMIFSGGPSIIGRF
ncbi:MAG: tetratricopeptide repeat protein [Pseudomonadota bacterium]